jgi:exoribonuclease R
MNYNDIYDLHVNPLYGPARNTEEDTLLINKNILPHNYNINDRIDMTDINTYSIDPDGCEDADDAFSVYKKEEELFLAIHIADPTEYINIESSLWNNIEQRIVTKYPSNKSPIHMMPKEIVDRSSLMVNQYGNIKSAITVVTKINKKNHHPEGKIQLLFTKIKVKQENALSYEKAGKLFYSNDTIYTASRISETLKEIRGGKTKGVVLNEVNHSYVKFHNNKPYLCNDISSERMMKQMIAEFAIFANSFIGEYLKINFEGVGLYRICSAKDWLDTVYNGITGQELLNEIIVNGIKAEYMSTVKSHDLVGAPEYCHFTSPIRRLSDCICHYLLKYIHLKQTNPSLLVPFTNDQLIRYSSNCVKITKSIKNIQYKDTKFRLIQTMNELLLKTGVINITYYITSYSGIFLNIIISSIESHTVYLSYTLRVPNSQRNYIFKQEYTLLISNVKCLGKFDEGSIPELDALYIHYLEPG